MTISFISGISLNNKWFSSRSSCRTSSWHKQYYFLFHIYSGSYANISKAFATNWISFCVESKKAQIQCVGNDNDTAMNTNEMFEGLSD